MVSVFGRPDPNTWDVGRDFSAFLNSSNIPVCSDQSIILLNLSGEEDQGLRKRMDNESDEK